MREARHLSWGSRAGKFFEKICVMIGEEMVDPVKEEYPYLASCARIF